MVDVQFQALQSLVAKGLMAIVEAKDGMLQFQMNPMGNPNFLQDTNSRLNDGIALLGNALPETSYQHRDLLKLRINPHYQALCGPSTHVTRLLFGDKILDSIRNEIQEMAKSVATIPSPGSQYNCQNRQFTQGSFSGHHSSTCGSIRGSSNY